MLSDVLLYILISVLIITIIFLMFRLQRARANHAAAADERDRLQLTLEISEDVGRFGSWHLDATTNLLKWSDYIFEMHERRHSLGQPPLEKAIGYYHPDDQPMVQTAVSQALEAGEDFEFRARIVTDRGNVVPVLARGTCQIGGTGKVLGIFGCFVDLSTPEDRKKK